MTDLQVTLRKRAALDRFLGGLPAAVVAYSGGVDSTLLAAAAHEVLGDRALAITARSPSIARRELASAEDLARRAGWNHRVVDTGEVAREEYARNGPDRCYWCKTELFDTLVPIARARAAVVLVGTNVDDLSDHRPGGRAAREQGVLAPFVEVDLKKDEIRALSRLAGLPTADKPASPCLASRFAYGVRVTPEGLRRVEAAEEVLRSLGLDVLRVRDHGDLARIEVPVDRIEEVAAHREVVTERLLALGFKYVTLDLQGFRSGALNEMLTPPRIAPSSSGGGDTAS